MRFRVILKPFGDPLGELFELGSRSRLTIFENSTPTLLFKVNANSIKSASRSTSAMRCMN